MSRRATREAHRKIGHYHPPEGAGPGCAFPALLVLLVVLGGCARAPTPQDQADLQALASTVAHASACVPPDEATASMQALVRLGVRLTSRAQAEALWQAATPTLTAVAHWLAGWVLQRPPP